jgi:hypothetical protein
LFIVTKEDMTTGFGKHRVPLSRPFIPSFWRVPLELLLRYILLTLIIPVSSLADEVRLRNGDVLEGTVLDRTDAEIVLEHPDLGRMTIPTRVVESISEAAEREGVPTTEVAETPPEGSEEITKAEVSSEEPLDIAEEKDKRLKDWTLGFVFGGTFTNNDEGEKISLNTRMTGDRKRPGSETSLGLSYIYKLDNDEIDEDKLITTLDHRWLKPDSPWFYYASARYDQDEFRSWHRRIQGHGGSGYRIIEKENLQLAPFLGLGLRKDIGSEDEDFPVEASGGVIFDWESKWKQTVSLQITYFRDLIYDEYRFVTIADWKIPFTRRTGKGQLSFNTHLDYEYASKPDPNFPHNNISLNWGLQWDY